MLLIAAWSGAIPGCCPCAATLCHGGALHVTLSNRDRYTRDSGSRAVPGPSRFLTRFWVFSVSFGCKMTFLPLKNKNIGKLFQVVFLSLMLLSYLDPDLYYVCPLCWNDNIGWIVMQQKQTNTTFSDSGVYVDMQKEFQGRYHNGFLINLNHAGQLVYLKNVLLHLNRVASVYCLITYFTFSQ